MDKAHSRVCHSCEGRRAFRGAPCEVCDGTGRVADAELPTPEQVRERFDEIRKVLSRICNADSDNKSNPPS